MTSSDLPRVAVVVPGLAEGGGVPAVALFLRDVLARSGRYEPHLISLATSRHDDASVRVLAPSSWRRGPTLARGVYEGHPFQHAGCIGAELEFQRYRPRRVLTELLDRFDLVQVVAGTPAWAWVARDVRRPVLLQVASMITAERRAWLARMRGPERLAREALTRITARLDVAALEHCRLVFVENAWMHAEMVRRIGAERVRFTPPGIDVERFRPATPDEREALDRAAPRSLLCVGRLAEPRKNVRLLLDAYRIVRDRRPDAPRLVLAGQHAPTAADLAHARALGLEPHLDVRTALDVETLARTYREALAFVLSSDEEGLGLVLLEAMASGVPVVSTRCGGPETAVLDGETGFLVPTGDADALAARILTLVEDGELRDRMGAAARERAVAHFSHQATAERFLSAWDAVLGAHASSVHPALR